MNIRQILDVLNQGIVIFDKQYKVTEWNQWMVLHSSIEREDIIGKNLFLFFPDLNNPSFLRNCKAVFNFGNIAFLSQKIHSYLFKFKLTGSQLGEFEYMQQSSVIAPLKDDNDTIESCIITIQDVTESVIVERKLRTMNMVDSLTEVFNRRHLDLRMTEEFSRHKRYNYNFSIIMFDIDNFKEVNDTYGHQFGDNVLKEVARRAHDTLRESDILTRYGGEEFCCILPETDINGAIPVAERIRSDVAGDTFGDSTHQISLSVSLGVAQIEKKIMRPEEVLNNADLALLKAKQEGKNRVIVHKE